MNDIEIVFLNPAEIQPYKNNPRNNNEAVPAVAESIKQYGFKVPIIIDSKNEIVTGHTRWKASKLLGLDKVPCIRADDLTDEQIREFRLVDNKVGELATWDLVKLDLELDDIEIDMSVFGFELDDFEDQPVDDFDEEDDDGWYGDERERTNRAYHLELIDYINMTDDFWQMPIIWNDEFIPKDLIGFNYAKTNKEKNVGVHFYVDDYQFERVWNYPEKYVDVLKQYDCVLSPDFSLYMDMPTPIKVWNTYRSRQIGAYYQSLGIKVIPTISWAEEESFEYCFRGIPTGSIVSVSTIGVKRDAYALSIWQKGMDEMIRQIEPSSILLYGGALEYDYKGIEIHEYKNKVLENWTDKGE